MPAAIMTALKVVSAYAAVKSAVTNNSSAVKKGAVHMGTDYADDYRSAAANRFAPTIK